jgi:hypothetical protein
MACSTYVEAMRPATSRTGGGRRAGVAYHFNILNGRRRTAPRRLAPARRQNLTVSRGRPASSRGGRIAGVEGAFRPPRSCARAGSDPVRRRRQHAATPAVAGDRLTGHLASVKLSGRCTMPGVGNLRSSRRRRRLPAAGSMVDNPRLDRCQNLRCAAAPGRAS